MESISQGRRRVTAWARRLGHTARAIRANWVADGDVARRVGLSGFFAAEDIGWVSDTYTTEGTAPGGIWERVLKDAHMSLPAWFQPGLDPLGEAYAAQQHRLWQLIAGIDRPYQPEVDEKEHSWGDIDPVRSPGYFNRRDPLAVSNASDHVLATGMLLKHCGLKPGDRALEYGAGFGQSALTLARLGVQVDTVDISATFCEFIRRQAEFFAVPLTPFVGRFGLNPRPDEKYKAIWFYESFHHCVEFQSLVQQLHDLLAPGGRVLLGGEPIVEREYAAVPDPWGVRLHSEVVAVVRRQGWFELGFSEDFLFELFANAGFSAQRFDCEATLFGRLYVFERRADEVPLAGQWLPPRIAEGWRGVEPDGRWTRAVATLPVDASDRFSALEIELANPRGRRRRGEVEYGDKRQQFDLAPGKSVVIRFDAAPGVKRVVVSCRPRRPTWSERLRSGDRRALGVLVQRLRYRQ
jgi:SAM-dependent methyltransferase